MDVNNYIKKTNPGVNEPHEKDVVIANFPSQADAEKSLIESEKQRSVPVKSPMPTEGGRPGYPTPYCGISGPLQQQYSTFRRLGGAAKKRMNWLIRQGKSYSEAYYLAMQPLVVQKLKEEQAKHSDHLNNKTNSMFSMSSTHQKPVPPHQPGEQYNKSNEVTSATAELQAQPSVVPQQDKIIHYNEPLNVTPTSAFPVIMSHVAEVHSHCNNTDQIKPTSTEFSEQSSVVLLQEVNVQQNKVMEESAVICEDAEVQILHQTDVHCNKRMEEKSTTSVFPSQSSLLPPQQTTLQCSTITEAPVSPPTGSPIQSSNAQYNTAAEVISPFHTQSLVVLPQHINVQNNETMDLLPSTSVIPTLQSPSKRQHQQTIEHHNSQWIKVYILHKDYPISFLRTDQLKEVLDLILRNIVMQKEVKPRFHGTSFKPGYVIVTCDNRETSEWLKSLEGKLILKEGLEVKIVDEFHLPKPNVAIGSFDDCREDSNEFILKLIGVQNGELNVDTWRVLRRTEEEQTHMIFAIDPESAKWLAENGEKISFKFGETKLRVKGKNPFTLSVADTLPEHQQKIRKILPSNIEEDIAPNSSD